MCRLDSRICRVNTLGSRDGIGLSGPSMPLQTPAPTGLLSKCVKTIFSETLPLTTSLVQARLNLQQRTYTEVGAVGYILLPQVNVRESLHTAHEVCVNDIRPRALYR